MRYSEHLLLQCSEHTETQSIIRIYRYIAVLFPVVFCARQTRLQTPAQWVWVQRDTTCASYAWWSLSYTALWTSRLIDHVTPDVLVGLLGRLFVFVTWCWCQPPDIDFHNSPVVIHIIVIYLLTKFEPRDVIERTIIGNCKNIFGGFRYIFRYGRKVLMKVW